MGPPRADIVGNPCVLKNTPCLTRTGQFLPADAKLSENSMAFVLRQGLKMGPSAKRWLRFGSKRDLSFPKLYSSQTISFKLAG